MLLFLHVKFVAFRVFIFGQFDDNAFLAAAFSFQLRFYFSSFLCSFFYSSSGLCSCNNFHA